MSKANAKRTTSAPAKSGKKSRTKQSVRKGAPSSMEALPFTRPGRQNKAGHVIKSGCWWNVQPTGHYASDFATGTDYARAYFEQAQINAGPAMLVWIVEAMALSMVPRGRSGPGLDGIAVGFITGIGRLLQRGVGLAAFSAVALGADGRRPSRCSGR